MIIVQRMQQKFGRRQQGDREECRGSENRGHGRIYCSTGGASVDVLRMVNRVAC